jgi:hypothetical protein
MNIHALEQTIVSGTQTFPIFVGFITAEELLRIAEVPNFKNTTPNHDIATNVLTPPVKEWQRPLIQDKKEGIIQTFNGTGEFMPNPVLLAERCIGPTPKITIDVLMATSGIPTPVKIISILEPASGEVPPLWIIDGQHRITGLGDPSCIQKNNLIPIVLLLNNGGTFYNGRNLAKIFAQVTTEATPLAPLHKEWLTFAFNLDSYAAGSPVHKAMEAVATLCKMPQNLHTNKVNGFHDDIKFNDQLSNSPKFLGHQYDCKDMSAIVSAHYYSESSAFGHLDPIDLACQISTAFESLRKSVSAPHDASVFFGDAKHVHKIMIDAFLVGVLTHLRNTKGKRSEAEWDDLLKKLKFHLTDCNFQKHIIKTSRWVDKSKALALDVFAKVFRDQSLPPNVANIWDYLSGDQLFIKIEFKHLNSKGNAIKKNSLTATYGRGDKKTAPMEGRKYFRVCEKSVNAKHLELIDEKSSPSDSITFKPSGEYLRLPKVDPNKASQDPLTLTIKCTLYGGIEERITVSLAGWK